MYNVVYSNIDSNIVVAFVPVIDSPGKVAIRASATLIFLPS